MIYRVMAKKYGYIEIEADDERTALELAEDKYEEDFEWEYDGVEVVEEWEKVDIMSYTRFVDDMVIYVKCASNPEANYAKYCNNIAHKIIIDGYRPKTDMENLVSMIVLSFDCDDNYGEYDEETGFGGYGEEFTLEECFRYVEEHGGYAEFDYYC